MTLDDFTNLLDGCGADAAHWPPGARDAAQRLLAVSEPARASCAALAAAEAALAMTRSDDGGGPDIAARAMLVPQASPAADFRRKVSLALAASLVLSVGLAAGASGPRPEDPSSVLASALYTSGEGADVE